MIMMMVVFAIKSMNKFRGKKVCGVRCGVYPVCTRVLYMKPPERYTGERNRRVFVILRKVGWWDGWVGEEGSILLFSLSVHGVFFRLETGAAFPLFPVGHVHAMHCLSVADRRTLWIRIVEQGLYGQEDLANRRGWAPLAVPRAVVRVEDVEAELPRAAHVYNDVVAFNG